MSVILSKRSSRKEEYTKEEAWLPDFFHSPVLLTEMSNVVVQVAQRSEKCSLHARFPIMK
ncbi:hypothetical protein UP10_41880 [Bradyrhizobium sp. LTSPM299]|nr:hypothetical protein UP10_41880 [Bradyrhizobium sp. LTSPM299]